MKKRPGFFGSAIRIAVSGVSAQIVVFLSLPLLSRLYDAESFGIWAIVQSTSLLIGAVATCRYELAVVLPQTHTEAVSVFGVGILIAIAVAIGSALILPVVAPVLLGEISEYSIAFWAVPLLVFFNALYQLGLSWGIRTERFTLYGFMQLLLALLTAAFSVVFVSQGNTGLVIGSVLATGFTSVGLAVWASYFIYKEGIWRELSLSGMKMAGIKYKNYPIFMTPYTLLSTIRERLIYFLLGNYASAGEVGLYSMAQRLTNASNSLAASALRPVFFQHVVNGDPQEIPELIGRVMFWLTVVAVPPATLFFFYSEFILRLVLGTGWDAAAAYVMILAVAMLPLMLGNWMDRYFDALGKQRLAFLMELLFSIFAVTVLFGVFALGASAKTAVIFQAIAMAVYFTLWILVIFHVAKIPRLIFWKTLGVVSITILLSATSVYIFKLWLDFWVVAACHIVLWLTALLFAWKRGC